MGKEERTELISIRVTARDRRAFEKVAEEEGMTLSECVRASALAYLAMRFNPHGLRMLAEGVVKAVEDGLKKFHREQAKKKAGGVIG